VTHTLALEIGTEEIPAGYLPPAAAQLQDILTQGLLERRLSFGRVQTLAAPRRLLAIVHDLADRQEDLSREVLGPQAKVAFGPDGSLTKAGEGFARSQNVSVESLRRVETPKGQYVATTIHERGRPSADVLAEWLPRVIPSLTFPKTMKWVGEALRFARPIRWLLVLLDDRLLPVQVGPLSAGRTTRGHRLFASGPIDVPHGRDILSVLERAGVIADPARRSQIIRTEIEKAARAAGGRIVEDARLIEEVTYLVEYPTAVLGSFDPEFLSLPREVLTTAMKSHQRYFAVENGGGRLMPHFVAVANGRWDDPRLVAAGNERVLRARLADARFYWDVDLKAGLDRKVDELKTVVWLEGAGTLYDRTIRIEGLVKWLGTRVRASNGGQVASPEMLDAAGRAAHLSKADLATEMIKDGKEFTSLQGLVGGEYARALGEPEEVVLGIQEHYAPRGAGDPLPPTVPGLLLSLADRFDALAGCFAMGIIPSGSQDPYALRRAANGVMRILLEKGWHLCLSEAATQAVRQLPPSALERSKESPDGVVRLLKDFFGDRIEYFLRESGLPYDVVGATLGAGELDPVDARARAEALAAIRGEADLTNLVIGFKRAANILKGTGEELPSLSEAGLAQALPVEKGLYAAAMSARRDIEEAMKTVDYPKAVTAFLKLKSPIDAFFNGVMVMSQDETERKRRLAILREVKALFDRLYDLTKIVVEGQSVSSLPPPGGRS
jgi:glycyl-tRNA synthetase beta chain